MKIEPITATQNHRIYTDRVLEANLNRVLERIQNNEQVSQLVVQNLLRTAGTRFADTCAKIRAFYNE